MAVGQTINVGKILAELEVDSGKVVQGLGNGRRAMTAFKNEMRQLDADLKGGAIGSGQYAARVAVVTANMARLNAAMKTAYSTATISAGGLDVFNKQAGKLSSTNWGRFALGMQQVGNIADDLQYSLQACVNNIGPMVQGLTGSIGIAAAAQIAAVGINYLVTHWDQLTYRLTGDDSKFRDAANSIEGLTKYVKMLREELEGVARAGDAIKLTQLEEQLRDRNANEKAGKSASEDNRSDKEKKESDRFEEALRDVEAGKRFDAMKTVASQAAKDEYDAAMKGDNEAKRKFAQKYLKQEDFEYYEEMRRSADNYDSMDPRKKTNSYPGAGAAALVRGKKAFEDRAQDALEDAMRAALEKHTEKAGAAVRDKNARMMFINEHLAAGRISPEQAETMRGGGRTRNEADKIEEQGKKNRARVARTMEKFFQGIGEKALKMKKKQDADAEREAEKKAKQAEAEIDAEMRLHDDKLQEFIQHNREVKRKREKNVREAQDIVPGADDMLKNATLLEAGGVKKGAVKAAADEIRRQLKASGKFNDKEIDAAIKEMTKDASKKHGDEIVRRAFGGGKNHDEARNSEVLQGGQIGAKVQAAISNDAKKIDLLEQIKDNLAEMKAAELRRKGIMVTVR